MTSSLDDEILGEDVTEQEEGTRSSPSDVPKPPPYKSFKKKYRKMRIKFDEAMCQSNTLFMEEQLAEETAKRLVQENDRLMDLLLDINNSAQIPADKRIDLSIGGPALAKIPALVSKEELAEAAEDKSPEGQAIYKAVQDLLKDRDGTNSTVKPSKSLAQLMATIPHISLMNPYVPPQSLADFEPLSDKKHPIGYLSLEEMDNYLYEVDALIGEAPALETVVYPPTMQDITLKNPHSVLNWLRRHEPKIFLQDGEGPTEKINAKPGALRGAGKRANIPAPTRFDSLEIVEEDGIGYDTTLSGPSSSKAKRKRDPEDDGGYTPKSGNPINKIKRYRPSKRKFESTGEPTASSSSRKSKSRAKNSSPVDTGPAPHPFGPID
ncbi:hypothetical protein DSL72_006637 [Monilinia vaccinii-corymbosi]|uniref:IEC3 subunit of the Ino80 complex, chromatin re-modelling-domain-containing protein n=1 Tax=Monilinia vaccinii-corymbosi TaxID=61207 RepID=A0A8A3PPB5_9HELO|nr:hypothetical protein DSL72_006637 [Monilinia vaccinii-corymbosi]